MDDLINWSELSRLVMKGGSRVNIRSYKIHPKHFKAIDEIINKNLPEWWDEKKAELRAKSEELRTKNYGAAFYCQRHIELNEICKEQCDHCKEYYAPIERKG